MLKSYKFEMEGTAAGGQTWKTSGDIDDNANDLVAVFDTAMRKTFHQLTSGKAVFGKPGIGCAGPYDVQRFVLTQVPAQ
jgi:hypothetical protein